MTGDPWEILCGNSLCPYEVNKWISSIEEITNPYSCINHALVIFINILLLFIYLFPFFHKLYLRKKVVQPHSPSFQLLPMLSTIFNGGLGLAYMTLGIWMIQDKLRSNLSIIPLHNWLEVLVQGFTWLFLCLNVTLTRRQCLQVTLEKLLSIMVTLFTGFLCIPSIWEATVKKETSLKNLLDMLTFPAAILLLLCTFKGKNYISNDSDTKNGALYEALKPEEARNEKDLDDRATPFARAGLLSKMSFWWMNPLLKSGKEKLLEDKDIPNLRHSDKAERCYSTFMEKLTERTPHSPSILSTIFKWHYREIIISGLFALTKVVALATGPLLLRAFIRVSQGKENFKYEGYVLTVGLFSSKCLESLSERQWNFKTRLIGLQVKSMLCTAIYQKQLRLSNDGKTAHSPGQIMNYITVDADRIGEFPFWFHQIWTTSLQLSLALLIMFYSVGLATFSALIVIVFTIVGNYPVAKLQHTYLTKLMAARDSRLKGITEAVIHMKVLKLYAWDTHFKNVIAGLRKEELTWLKALLSTRGYYIVLFWSSSIIVSITTFFTCYLIGIPLNVSNVFTFLATIRLIQQPVAFIPDVAAVFIEAKVALTRIVKFLEAPELNKRVINKKQHCNELENSIIVNSTSISWNNDSSKATLTNVNLSARIAGKVAICGEVGSGKSTLIAAILGEVPNIHGKIQVYGKIAYVSQTAWIQTGTIQENILFGSHMHQERYKEVLTKCSLVKDLEMLPFGDHTVIGERGVNLSGGQKQRVQLARALYQDADIYLLDDPFSAVDAHTAASLFQEYVMEALARKTVLLVTHQVDFLPAFDKILLMSEGKILQAGTYTSLLSGCKEFQNLIITHNGTVNQDKQTICSSQGVKEANAEITTNEDVGEYSGDQLIKEEEREAGDTGLKSYIQYLSQSNKGFFYFFVAVTFNMLYLVGQLAQSLWLAADMEDSNSSELKVIIIYIGIGCAMTFFLLLRSYFIVILGIRTSESIFSKLMMSLFRAPMSFYDSTPVGRILSRVSSDQSIVDLELAFRYNFTAGATMTTCFIFGVLGFLTWPILFVIILTVYVTYVLQITSNLLKNEEVLTEFKNQKFYLASAKEFMRINGTTKSSVASSLAESIAGGVTIRAFGEEDRFINENFRLIDANASPSFHNFSANEWLIQRLEILCTVVVSVSALAMTHLPVKPSDSGFIGMTLSYGLSLNAFLVNSIQDQCRLSDLIISMERIQQYLHIPTEAPEIITGNQPSINWPSVGRVEIRNLKVKYQANAPLVLQGISCIFEGGHKIGVVGRTGSGKTTLINALFRIVEPTEGSIIIDGLSISSIGLRDLRSHIAIIPQEPTLFNGSVRYNLDPLAEHSDHEIWKVLEQCQLREAVQTKEMGLNSLVAQDGSNWSMGQRQLFCLGRALLKRRKILVLDEATASIDNATDAIIQKTIREEFADSTVITVAHRIPTVMDSTMVLALSDGKIMEYDEPTKLMNQEGSLFRQLVNEYWAKDNERLPL